MRELGRSAWLIAAAALFPLLLYLAFQTGFSAREERREIEARAQSTARIVIAATDAVLARNIAGLEALATAGPLRDGDWKRSYDRARQIANFNPDWVTVTLTQAQDGSEYFDLRRPFGVTMLSDRPRPRPNRTRIAGIEREGRGCPCVRIEGPAPRNTILSVLVSNKAFQRVLPDEDLFEVSAIVDGQARFVARTLRGADLVGRPAAKAVRAAVTSGKSSGIYRGRTLEGVENYSAFTRSPMSGWSAHLALGTHRLDDPTRMFLSSLGAAALLSLGLAGVLIWFALRQIAAGRRIAERGQQAQKLEALGQLTGGIAHDFNNLLTPVVGALDFLIQRGELDTRARRIADGALASARRAGKLTAQLLAFSRRQRLQIVPVDVPGLLDDLRPLLEQSAGKDHVVDIEVEPGVHCVRTDLNQLELAILNLVINARDAMPGGGTIRVRLSRDDQRGHDEIVIRVSDEGEGMNPETRRRAVEPFFTTKSQGHGTGLGLAQVFGVMEQSGGSVDIASEVGRGTTVTLRLPSCDEVPAPRAAPFEAPERETRSLRLLLVDDDAAVRATISRLFEDEGHIVDSVGDGRIALTAIEHCDYDLVIVDFAMPVMDGAAVIREARKVRPGVRFLMVTGYADSDAVTAACPDTPVIRKPFEGEALRDLVIELTA